MTKKVSIGDLINEFVYQRYIMANNHIREYFTKIKVPEYIALGVISENSDNDDIYEGKTYLKDLADTMQVPIRKISQIVGNLRDRGLVNWSYDGAGDEGTYVVITEAGAKLITDQEEKLKDYYGRVIERFGTDHMIQLLDMMKRLETVMSLELDEKGGSSDDETAE